MTKRQSKKKVKVCIDCGAVIQGRAGQKLCGQCRKKRERARSKARHEVRREQWLHTPQRCGTCGMEFTAKSKSQYCPTCRNFKRGEARRRETKWVSWTAEMARRGRDNQPDPALADRPEQAELTEENTGEGRRSGRQAPKPPPKGTRPGSMEDVSYRLDKENYERWLRGESPISYGYFVAYLEGRIPLKK